MIAFCRLFTELDETTRTGDKLAALTRYFQQADPADAAWAVHFLVGRRPKSVVPRARLMEWAARAAGIEPWLLDECQLAVGDLAETIALLVPGECDAEAISLHRWVEERLLPMARMDEDSKRETLLTAWASLDQTGRFVWNKLITGGFRVGVSRQLVARGLASALGQPLGVITHRLMGDWQPSPAWYQSLALAEGQTDTSRPYPFFLASPVEGDPAGLGSAAEWQAEWKWDGIRAQAIRRAGQVHLWTRGEELVTDRYPEVALALQRLPRDAVLDGELLQWFPVEAWPGPFGQLQKRIGRKTVGKKLLADLPVAFQAYDCMELEGVDLRERPLRERRRLLQELLAGKTGDNLRLSPILEGDWSNLWEMRQQSRQLGTEGLMLKRLDSPYRDGRARGDWWKWKIDPFSIDAVLVAAQRGRGRRASLMTDYTFAVWHEGKLVTIAKAYSGLTDEELVRVDKFARTHTREKFGAGRTVEPVLVFELAFEGIQRSTRHKSGIALRFPRIARWRHDKKPEEADHLSALMALLPVEPAKPKTKTGELFPDWVP